MLNQYTIILYTIGRRHFDLKKLPVNIEFQNDPQKFASKYGCNNLPMEWGIVAAVHRYNGILMHPCIATLVHRVCHWRIAHCCIDLMSSCLETFNFFEIPLKPMP